MGKCLFFFPPPPPPPPEISNVLQNFKLIKCYRSNRDNVPFIKDKRLSLDFEMQELKCSVRHRSFGCSIMVASSSASDAIGTACLTVR